MFWQIFKFALWLNRMFIKYFDRCAEKTYQKAEDMAEQARQLEAQAANMILAADEIAETSELFEDFYDTVTWVDEDEFDEEDGDTEDLREYLDPDEEENN